MDKQILDFLYNNLTGLITGVIGVIASIISLFKVHFLRKSVTELNKFIKTTENKYYITCPNCSEKILLKDVDIKE